MTGWQLSAGGPTAQTGARGDVIDYTITATTSGLATLTSVDISDEFPGGLDDFTCTLAGETVTLPVSRICEAATSPISTSATRW